MELNKAIETRRSIREYKNDVINKEDIITILKNGTLAPSAKNKQPWEFVVIQNKDLLLEISEALLKSSEHISGSLLKTSEIIKNAPVLVLVFNNILEDDNDWYSLSIGACIENMLLTATSLNIGSLWIGYVNRIRKEINEILNINDKVLMSAIVFGIKDEDPSMRPRNDVDTITMWRD